MTVQRDPAWWRQRHKDLTTELGGLLERREELDLRIRAVRYARHNAGRNARYFALDVGFENPSWDSDLVEVANVIPHIEAYKREMGHGWRLALARRANVSTRLLTRVTRGHVERITFRSYDRIMTALGAGDLVAGTPVVPQRTGIERTRVAS